VALVLSLLVISSIYSDNGARATTFNPQFSSPVAFSDTMPAGHPDIRVGFDIPPPSALGGAINFSDPALTTATDVQIPTGAYIGQVASMAKLGLFNGGCNSNIPATFDLVEASTPATTSVTISGSAGNLAEDDGDLDEDGTVDQPAFATNGIADGADAYPSQLLDLLDPDGPGGPVTPVVPTARYFGADIVFNLAVVSLQVVVLEPGALAAFSNQSWMTPPWGIPSLIILGDPNAPPSNASGITDFCNISSNSTIMGVTHDNLCTPAAGGAPPGCSASGGGFTVRKTVDGGCPGSTTPNECGFVRATNPATTKTLKARVYAISDRDYDDDGHANSLDVCAFTPNSAWDPRTSNLNSQDSDADGLPNACDSSALSNTDEDGDGWSNRIDNCPTTHNSEQPGNGGGTAPNTFQWDQDVPREQPVGDGGTDADGIGAACDIAANGCAGCSDLTPTGPNGHYHATVIVSHVCIGVAGDDSDGDGVCNADELAALECLGGVNDTDCDNDGTGDQLDSCIAGPNVPPSGFAQSQRDLTADDVSDIADIDLLASAFGALGGDPAKDGAADAFPPGYQGRLDITYDSVIDIADIDLLAGVFAVAC